MNCPICTKVDLLRSERFGLDVDRCPDCRGVWLDAHALDRLTDRLVEAKAGDRRHQGSAHDSSGRLMTQRSRSHSSGRLESHRGRRSWWREMFD